MTEYVYKLKNGKVISAYADEKENISITKEALEIMVNSWNEGYLKGRAYAIDELETNLIDIILGNEEFTDWQKQEISLCLECAIEQLKEQNSNKLGK